MKCISLWQPWATLFVTGAKKIETRSWATRYKGWIAIHAAKKWDAELRGICYQPPFLEAIYKGDRELFKSKTVDQLLPFGAIIGAVKLDSSFQVDVMRSNVPEGDELHFGDYTPGRYMWKASDFIELSEPIAYKGSQGMFDIPNEIVKQIFDVIYKRGGSNENSK